MGARRSEVRRSSSASWFALAVWGSELLQRDEEGKEWEVGSMPCTTRLKDEAPRGPATHGKRSSWVRAASACGRAGQGDVPSLLWISPLASQ